MKILIEIAEDDIKALVIDHIKQKIGDIPFDLNNLKIETKSKYNWKAEWESTRYHATYTSNV